MPSIELELNKMRALCLIGLVAVTNLTTNHVTKKSQPLDAWHTDIEVRTRPRRLRKPIESVMKAGYKVRS